MVFFIFLSMVTLWSIIGISWAEFQEKVYYRENKKHMEFYSYACYVLLCVPSIMFYFLQKGCK